MTGPECSDRHVLLIEDHAVLRQFVAMALVPLTATVHGCASVAEARAWIGIHGVPDLLLTDLVMPGEDGQAFVTSLRAGADWQRSLPVIMMTAAGDDARLQALAPLGLRQVLLKPLDIEVLRDAVRSVLCAPFARSADTVAAARFGGDQAMYAQFRAAALVQFPADMQQIDAGVLAGDWGAVRRTAHSLKGVFALLCEDAASEVARRLEQADPQRAGIIWPVLRNWLAWYVRAGVDASSSAGRPPSLHLPAT